MTAPRLLPPALAADFMPLGDLYETELADLFPGFPSPAPDAAMRDSLLIRLHRAHESATPLAGLFPESELDIRRWQRRARASEMCIRDRYSCWRNSTSWPLFDNSSFHHGLRKTAMRGV